MAPMVSAPQFLMIIKESGEFRVAAHFEPIGSEQPSIHEYAVGR
jgi:hypothetical protein